MFLKDPKVSFIYSFQSRMLLSFEFVPFKGPNPMQRQSRCVCVFVQECVCRNVCMCMCVYVCVCVYAYVYVYVYECMYVCGYV